MPSKTAKKPKKRNFRSRARPRPTDQKSQPAVVISLLLDATQSMLKHRPQTMSAANEYVENLRGALVGRDVHFTLVRFSTIERRTMCAGVPLIDVPTLSAMNYPCGGMTNLYDAAMQTIQETERAVAGLTNPKVIVVLQTDGENNASTYTLDQLKAAISRHKEERWEFVFLGAGIDAYLQGAAFGVSALNTMSYGVGAAETYAMAQSLGSNTRAYATGISATMSFTAEQKFKAGDKFDPLLKKRVLTRGAL